MTATVTVSRPFTVRWPSGCTECGFPVPIGVQGVMVGARLLHETCLPDGQNGERCATCLQDVRPVFGGWKQPNYRSRELLGMSCGCPSREDVA